MISSSRRWGGSPVRLAVVGGREVRAELHGIGEAGESRMRRLSREMEAANARVATFYRRLQIAATAAAAAFAAGAAAMRKRNWGRTFSAS